MRIAAVSLRNFTTQNLNNQQKNVSSNVSFNAKRSPIDRFINAFKPLSTIHEEVAKKDFSYVINDNNADNLKKAGFNLYEKSVEIDIDGKKVKGATFIKTSPETIKILVTDDKFYTQGQISAIEMGFLVKTDFKFKGIGDKNLSNVGKAAYDSLFKYLKIDNPKIKAAHVFLHSDSKDFDSLHDFYLKYGFKELSSEGQPIRLLIYNLK